MVRYKSKQGCWLGLLAVLSLMVCSIMLVLVYLLQHLPPTSATQTNPLSNSLDLTATVSLTSTFTVKKPIRGVNSCEMSGFRGIVTSAEGKGVAGVQVVVWADKTKILTLETTDVGGVYQLKIEPTQPTYWLQLFAAERAISEAVPLEVSANCQTGYQVYQVDWQEIR